MNKDGWDGIEDVKKLQWTTTGALFYSIIVITTIGESLGKIISGIIDRSLVMNLDKRKPFSKRNF